jgi:hypothetical protein
LGACAEVASPLADIEDEAIRESEDCLVSVFTTGSSSSASGVDRPDLILGAIASAVIPPCNPLSSLSRRIIEMDAIYVQLRKGV